MDEELNGIQARFAPYLRWVSHFKVASRDSRLRGVLRPMFQKVLNGSGLMQCAFGFHVNVPASEFSSLVRQHPDAMLPEIFPKATRVMD